MLSKSQAKDRLRLRTLSALQKADEEEYGYADSVYDIWGDEECSKICFYMIQNILFVVLTFQSFLVTGEAALTAEAIRRMKFGFWGGGASSRQGV